MTKEKIRKEIHNLRKNQDSTSKTESEIKVFNFIKNWEYFKKAQNIGIYFSTKYELDTTNIIKEILESKKNCYLPVILNNNTFDFYLYNENIELIHNKYKILEPKPIVENKIDINDLDLIFIPIVAFNENKERLGMGGGFYDRALAKLNANSKTLLVGLAFDFQKNNKLQADSWDINLSHIITEKTIY